VAFAEVEKFIDTPVKHYSSGMYLRLAFAVAAHLEPEILIVDEVLAVGDARFQKKCLNKMQDVGQEGRTVLFVSHNMPAITRLCRRAILLEEGEVTMNGSSHHVVSTYLRPQNGTTAEIRWPDPKKAPGGEIAKLIAVRVKTEDGQITDVIDIRQSFIIEMEYEVIKPGYILLPHYLFRNNGIVAFMSLDNDQEWRKKPRPTGRYISKVTIHGNLLAEGMFSVDASLITLDPVTPQFDAEEAVSFQVIDSHDGDSVRGDWTGNLPGVMRPLLKWSTQFSPTGR
jgi:lipopolysaccharide transport system ATP-binding protein